MLGNNNQLTRTTWDKIPAAIKNQGNEFITHRSAVSKRKRKTAHRKRMSVQQKRAAQGKR